MNYTRSCSWSGYNEPAPESSGNAPVGMSKEFRRKIMQAVGNEPSFRCPTCAIRFKMIYATYGRLPKSFSETQFYCKDCAKELGVIRRD